MSHIISEETPPVSRLRPKVPPELDVVIAREMACARRNNEARTATALEETWAVGLLVDDPDRFSPACHTRFSNAFLAIMTQRITMLSGRLLHALQAEKIGMV